MCCEGKNATCVVDSNDYSDDYVANSAPCYCDHGCLDVGDCCPDFKDYCGGKNCLAIINMNFKIVRKNLNT